MRARYAWRRVRRRTGATWTRMTRFPPLGQRPRSPGTHCCSGKAPRWPRAGWAVHVGCSRTEPEKREHGWLAVREAELAHASGHDPAGSLAAARQAAAIGRRHRDPDLEQAGLGFAGLALVGSGEVTAGMKLLDAAAVAATAGDVRDPMWMGKICCWLIAACVQAQDVERAAEWCRRMAAVSERQRLMPLFNVCRVRYAELCILRGDWAEAEQDLSAAIERLVHSRRDTRLSAVAQLGELRRRQGRQHEAEKLLQQAEFVPEARVSRALLALERGDPDAAWRAIAEVLAEMPPAAQLDRAAVLPSAVVVALAADDPDAAACAAAELQTIAARIGTDRLLGQAAVATGRLAGDVAAWRAAVRHFRQAGLRFDEAEARCGLGQALLAGGATDEANEHLESRPRDFRGDRSAAPRRRCTRGGRTPQHRAPQRAPSRGPRARRPRAHQRRDRPSATPQRAHRAPPPVEQLHRARSQLTGRRHGIRPQQRARRPPFREGRPRGAERPAPALSSAGPLNEAARATHDDDRAELGYVLLSYSA